MKHLLLPLIILIIACNSNRERQSGSQFKLPVIVEAKERKIDPATVAPPVVVPATPPVKRLLTSPEITQVLSNILPAKITQTISAAQPKLVLPAGKKFEPPVVVRAKDSQYIAKPPEVQQVDAPHYAETSTGMFSSIKAKDGLNSEEISGLLQDESGNIWISQWWGGGISRYDGRFLWNYTLRQGLSSEVINCICKDKHGDIWTGSYDNGVNKFDGKCFTHYSIKEGLRSNVINCILEGRAGNMWIGTGDGLTKFDGRNFTHYTTAQGLPSNRIRSLMQDKNGHLWVGADGGLVMFDGEDFLNYSTDLNFNQHTQVTAIMQDHKGNIWCGTNAGLYVYEGGITRHYTKEGGLPSNIITTLVEENNGDIWIGTNGGGASRYDGNSFIHYGPEQGLPNDRVTSVLQDKSGIIWLGTTGGVCKYEGKTFTHVFPAKQAEIEELLTDREGNVWLSSNTDGCLNKYDGKRMIRYTSESGLFNTEFNYLYQDKHGNIWFGTWNGVDKYDGKYLEHYTKENGLVDSIVFAVLEDDQGNYWFGTNKGLSKFDGKTFTNYLHEQGLPGETVFSVFQDRSGTFWLGTNDHGVCRFDGETFSYFDPGHGASHPMVIGIIQDRRNNIWLCTGYGINKYDGKNFTWYTSEQGLTNNITKNVIEDRDGHIWVGTINGINRYVNVDSSTDTLGTHIRSYFKKYTIADGFSGRGTYENAMSMDNKGIIWIGSNDRLTRYHPEGDIADTVAPTLMLTDISLFNEKINWQNIHAHHDTDYTLSNGNKTGKLNYTGLTKWYNQPENLELNYDNDAITFHFIGITTNRPKEVKYRYMLDGLDKLWTYTSEPVAVYNQLPHGKFTFKAQSVNSEGYWSNELNYPFTIFPPWWQTDVAYIAYAVGTIAILWMLVWYRSRKLRAENLALEEKVSKRTNELKESLEERYRLSEQIKSQQALLNERLRISRDLHDEIGSTLGSISIYSEVAKKRSEKNENPVTVLSKIGSASRELIERMSDIVWSLNLNHESFEQMQHRMQAFATMIFVPRNIAYEFYIDENCKQNELTNAQAKNIFLIYKESIYNIVKYADCTKARIHFTIKGEKLIMTIKDNGKGFNYPDQAPVTENLGGNGIKNMHVRADEIGASLKVDSQQNSGTTVCLSLPM